MLGLFYALFIFRKRREAKVAIASCGLNLQTATLFTSLKYKNNKTLCLASVFITLQ